MRPEKTLLVVGATSDIGHAVALRYAQAGWRIFLAARDLEGAHRNMADIVARTAVEAAVFELDIRDTSGFAGFVDRLPELPATVVCAVGTLGDQARAQAEPSHAREVIDVNFTGPSLLLEVVAERFRARGSGTLVGISSVAGDRGRGSNYVYGAAKAGFSAFLSGLRNRLAPSKVRVITVKPGFVRTRMTRSLKLPPFLTANPRELGEAIFAAAEGGRGDVIYVRRVWRPVMAIIRAIPERVFKKLRL